MKHPCLLLLAAVAVIWIGTGLGEVAGQDTTPSIVGSWGNGPTIAYIFTADGKCIQNPGGRSERKGTYKFNRTNLEITFVVKVKFDKKEEELPVIINYAVKSLTRNTLSIEDKVLQQDYTYTRTGSAPTDK